VVDAFVDAINLKSFGFAHVECKEEGHPPYHPALLVKLYLFAVITASVPQENPNGKHKPIWNACGF